jgi:predicted glycoside hydrolase/deacetylase ChbG (UPF0249 family)
MNLAPRSTQRASGALIVNADDWGRDRETTDRTLDCIQAGTVSSVSAMVFMAHSERAAVVACEHNIDAGLHLNFTTPFTSRAVPPGLVAHQTRVCRALRAHRFASVVFHPWLMGSFDYVVKTQLDEFRRLFGNEPARIDGHHHMHLCANVLARNLLPHGRVVRRNFSFRRGEKSILNRSYRAMIDGLLARRHAVVDYLFTLPPMEPRHRLEQIFALAVKSIVELETHPVDPREYRFLSGGALLSSIGTAQIKPFRALVLEGRRTAARNGTGSAAASTGRARQ